MPPLETARINSNSSVNETVVKTSIYHLCCHGFKTQSVFGAGSCVHSGSTITTQEVYRRTLTREEIHCSSLNAIATEIAGA